MRQCCRWLPRCYIITLNLCAFKYPKEGGLTGWGESLMYTNQGYHISSFVTSHVPVGTLHHLVNSLKSLLERKLLAMKSCLKAVDWARILLVGRGFWDHGPPNPQFIDTKGTWMGGCSHLGHELPPLLTAAWIQPPDRDNPHLSKCHGVCVQVFSHSAPSAQAPATHMQI